MKTKKKIYRAFRSLLFSYGAHDNNYLQNVFRRNFSRKALLSYIVDPFVSSENYTAHTNRKECFYIAKILDELGFLVDVIQYDVKIHNIDYSKYELIIGFGWPLENSFNYKASKTLKRIRYSTGQCEEFVNALSCDLANDFYKKYGFYDSKLLRFTNDSWPLQLRFCHVNVILGNKYVANTFPSNSSCEFRNLNIFYHSVNHYINDFSEDNLRERTYYCWFGSSSFLHKGLISLIEVFKTRPDEHLKIFGWNKTEKSIVDRIFGDLKNISWEDDVQIGSEKSYTQLSQIRFNIFPSLSEGGAPGVMNLAAIYAIPTIASNTVGIDDEYLGFKMGDIGFDSINLALNKAKNLNLSEYKSIAKRVAINAKSSDENKYISSWKRILIDAIS